MQLHSIRTVLCPHCQCTEVVGEGVKISRSTAFGREIRQHVNGRKWEYRNFLCGYGVEFSPNAGRDEVAARCSKDPEILERNAKRKAAHDKLLSIIADFDDLDDEYQSTLHQEIASTKWHFE